MAGDAEAGDASGTSIEPLACVSCRSRKLKCDRTSPACTRCAKVGAECVYPESRRKPVLKRRNVKELEERLAQVEGYLKDISAKGKPVEVSDDASPDSEQTQDVPMASYKVAGDASSSGTGPSLGSVPVDASASFARGQELMHLGMTEALPPFDVMEELNNAFFNTQYHHIPLIHAGRYYESFYSSAPRKPPMCLQYAIWALGSFGHVRFDGHSDIFYRRARQYLEMDEMRDDGEHFITLGHAQAWALTATYEARKLLFTRASVSCGKAVRLAQMMALDRLDSGKDDLPPALIPTKSWSELEERRRVFWSIFAIDCHASVSTGWPNLIRSDDIMTRLPASEEAFSSGIEETAPFLDEAIKGAQYASFAGTIITCECFKGILRHVFRPKPSEHPEDFVGGEFWRRHRELDNNLSSIFMFLPPSFRLIDNQRDPSAIYANLNLHASVICLHHAAIEQADKHDLSDEVKNSSKVRLKSAADEIVNIVKLTSHNTAIYKSPLCSLALYCASTVYVYLAKLLPSRTLPPPDVANLDIILRCMEAISRHHKITNGFLQQACLDIERNGLGSTTTVHLSALSKYRDFFGDFTANIPLLARSHVSGRSAIAPVLPGKLPLGNPKGVRFPDDFDYGDDPTYLASRGSRGTEDTVKRLINSECYQPMIGPVSRNMGSSRPIMTGFAEFESQSTTTTAAAGAKRKRTSAWNTPTAGAAETQLFGVVDATTAHFMSQFDPTNQNNMFIYPDRSRTPSTISSPAPALHRGVATTISSADGLGNTLEENRVDIKALQDRVSGPLWPLQEEESAMVAQIVQEIGTGDPWTFLTGEDPTAWVDTAL